MSIDKSAKMRLMLNNFAAKASIYNSGAANEIPQIMPLTNLVDESRSTYFTLPGRFAFGEQDKIHFKFDGVEYSVAINVEGLTRPELPDPITTSFYISNSIAEVIGYGKFFCGYTNGKFYFKSSGTSSFQINFSNTTDAAWPALGFNRTEDYYGKEVYADAIRKSWPCEYLDFDFGYSANVQFIALLGDAQKGLGISPLTGVIVKANSIPHFWDSPALTIYMDNYDDRGLFKFLDDIEESTAYRYWRIEFHNNEVGGNTSLTHVYLGDYTTITMRNVSTGLTWVVNDPSESSETVSGQLYYNDKPPFRSFDNLEIGLVNKDTVEELRRIFELKRTVEPFYCALDPKTQVSKNLADFTVYCKFVEAPTYEHILRDLYNFSFKLNEVI